MVISRLALPRRTVLRGMGATLALPFLDSMVPAFATKAATKPVKRFGVVYLPNGLMLRSFVPPSAGKDFEMTRLLKPLEKYRHQLTIVSGLSNAAAEAHEAGGNGPHSRTSGAWLSGTRPEPTEGADLRSGRTADQYAADVLGRETPLRSLEIALEPNFVVGVCEGSYSCTYINTFSWAAPDRPLPMETNPAVVFERTVRRGRSRRCAARSAPPGSQHPRCVDRRSRSSAAHHRPERSPHDRRVPGRGAGRRASHPTDWIARRRGLRYRKAVRHPGAFRGSREADDGPHLPCAPHGHDAGLHVPGRAGTQQPVVSGNWRDRSPPRHLAPRQRAGEG